jgi:hypothetical protein
VKKQSAKTPAVQPVPYTGLVGGIGELLAAARHASARAVNSFMTATYWEIGRRVVEFEQGGKERAEYGEDLLNRLAVDLTKRFGRGFSRFNLARFRSFYTAFPPERIRATLSLKSVAATDRSSSLESPAQLTTPVLLSTLDNLPSKVLAREYQLALPDEKRLVAEMEKARKTVERRVK